MAKNSQGPVLSKIDTFYGDNDNVEDEESSNDEVHPHRIALKAPSNPDVFGTP